MNTRIIEVLLKTKKCDETKFLTDEGLNLYGEIFDKIMDEQCEKYIDDYCRPHPYKLIRSLDIDAEIKRNLVTPPIMSDDSSIREKITSRADKILLHICKSNSSYINNECRESFIIAEVRVPRDMPISDLYISSSMVDMNENFENEIVLYKPPIVNKLKLNL